MTVETVSKTLFSPDADHEERYGPAVISFIFTSGNNIDIPQIITVRSNRAICAATDDSLCILTIWDDKNLMHGRIVGDYTETNGKRSFHSMRSDNLLKGKLKGLSGVVSAAIAQLVIQGEVDIWISSCDLSEEGEHMYTRLHENTELTVSKVYDEKQVPAICYRVQRKHPFELMSLSSQ